MFVTECKFQEVCTIKSALVNPFHKSELPSLYAITINNSQNRLNNKKWQVVSFYCHCQMQRKGHTKLMRLVYVSGIYHL